MNFIEYENNGLKPEDNYDITLFKGALTAQRLGLISNLLGQLVTILSIEEIYRSYESGGYRRLDINMLAILSLIIGVASGIKALGISVERYNYLLRKQAQGKISYSLQPNIDINIANALGIISNSVGIIGALGLRGRNGLEPLI